MKKVLAVYDGEIGYGEKLCSILRREADLPYTPILLHTKEELINFSQGEIGLLLVDRQMMDEDVRKVKADRILYLCDVKGYGKVENRKSLYKYQSSKMMIGEIMNAYQADPETFDDADNSLQKANYIAVSSPLGRCLKTGFCLTMGQLLAKQQKVLYVSLETFSSLPEMLNREFPHDLSDFMYCYLEKSHRQEMLSMIEEFHGMDMIPPVQNPEDILEMDMEVFDGCLQYLIKERHYETVIIEFGQNYTGLSYFLDRCSKVFVPSLGDAISQKRIEKFLFWLDKQRLGTKEYAQVIQLPYFQYIASSENYGEQLLWSELGDCVRQLMREI